MRRAEVIVVGSGAAGLMAALAASERRDTLLVTDGPLGRSNTMMAQGGLQLPAPSPSSLQSFIADIVTSARQPVSLERVRRFAASVGRAVSDLESWGLAFDRNPDGEIRRRAVGGMSEPRIVSVGDQIGPALMKVLIRAVRERDIEIETGTRVLAIRPAGGEIELEATGPGGEKTLRAPAVVCASGGITYLEARRRGERTTNPENENHVLYQQLLELGLETEPGDHFQYQPYGIVERATSGLDKCVPESIVALPVKLRDARGRTFEPQGMDRLEVTRRIRGAVSAGEAALSASGQPGLWLTLGDIDPAVIAEQFPRLHRLLERVGRVGADLLVHPFLHYQLGGFLVDRDGRTRIPGLLLAGEMVGGLHGQNRLMGNGLTDSLVHGRLAGRAAANESRG